MGNVANHPTIPATPPAIKKPIQEGPTEFEDEAELSGKGGECVNIRQVASYFERKEKMLEHQADIRYLEGVLTEPK